MKIEDKIEKHLVNEKKSDELLNHDGWIITNRGGRYQLEGNGHFLREVMNIEQLFKKS